MLERSDPSRNKSQLLYSWSGATVHGEKGTQDRKCCSVIWGFSALPRSGKPACSDIPMTFSFFKMFLKHLRMLSSSMAWGWMAVGSCGRWDGPWGAPSATPLSTTAVPSRVTIPLPADLLPCSCRLTSDGMNSWGGSMKLSIFSLFATRSSSSWSTRSLIFGPKR